MKKNLKLVNIDYNYCNYLRNFDKRVSLNAEEKELRPFVGILFVVHNCEYFVPISSPKEKHLIMKNSVDFYKIDNGKLGVLNFNNMIPVNSNSYECINFNEKSFLKSEKEYNKILKSQIEFINKNYNQIQDYAFRLYDLYINKKLSKNVLLRCCNFPLLERVCKEYEERERKRMLNIVLFEPEIPANTGNIMRTCVATHTKLHLIKPLGFSLEEKYIKRCGAGYIDKCNYELYDNIDDFFNKNKGTYYFLTRYGHKPHSNFDYSNKNENIYFIFGKESTGIPFDILKPHLDTCIRIPMTIDVRALNVSNAVAITIYEALRQQEYLDLSFDEPHKDKNIIENS